MILKICYTQEMKYCYRGKHFLEKANFSKSAQKKDGLDIWCKKCRKEYKLLTKKQNPEKLKIQRKKHYEARWDKAQEEHRAWIDKNREHVNAYNHRRQLARPEEKLWQNAKRRARKRGIEFTIEIKDIVIPEDCPVLGTPLSPGKGKMHDASPTLDRIDNTQGYIRDNIRVISYKANRAKGNLTKEEIHLLYLDSIR